ncbi:general stress protein [Brevibacterium ihuae]|uniref:general stress protein n=1 Tax=Brevibacterium ihuae TaxID=1631743 RepID=UPI001FE98978|nr:general stress protein [Brevibacterium ihuae]
MTENAATPAGQQFADRTPLAQPVPREIIARFHDYLPAQDAVDRLADAGFEVSTVRIVGHDLTTVEHVTGNMTWGKAAGYGALSGAWIGLLLGLVFALFVAGVGIFSVLLSSVALGAVWGLIFGLIGFAINGKNRSFRSIQSLKAAEYTLEVEAPRAAEAIRVLGTTR